MNFPKTKTTHPQAACKFTVCFDDFTQLVSLVVGVMKFQVVLEADSRERPFGPILPEACRIPGYAKNRPRREVCLWG